MFPDVAKLDRAQTRPDALVPVDTKGGTRKIGDGIYSFQTPELRGTIDLINWMNDVTGRNVGVTDLAQGAVQSVSKKATVVFAEQLNISKRFLLRSSSYTECMAEIGHAFINGAVDHMSARRAIRVLGAQWEEWDEITRKDLDFQADIDVRIRSTTQEMQDAQLKKEARMKTLSDISLNPVEIQSVNVQWLIEEKLRAGGEYDDAEIAVAMDTKNYGSKNEVARAHKAIQEIRENRKAELYYGATSLFLEIIHSYADEHRSALGDKKYVQYMDFIQAHAEIVVENTMRKAREDANNASMGQQAPGGPGVPGAPGVPGPAGPTGQPPQPAGGAVPSPMQTGMQPTPAVSQFANRMGA